MANSIAKAAKRNNDELFTPPILVEPIIKYLDKWGMEFTKKYQRPPKVLCPFDTSRSEFVKQIDKLYPTINGHINTGSDFFKDWEQIDFDIVISNPPFSRKLDVFKKLDSWKKPWAMVMNAMALNYHEIIDYFVDNEPELMFFNKRVSYDGNPSSFASCYICRDFLPQKLICEPLEHNNVGKYFKKSDMYNEFISQNYKLQALDDGTQFYLNGKGIPAYRLKVNFKDFPKLDPSNINVEESLIEMAIKEQHDYSISKVFRDWMDAIEKSEKKD